MDLEVAERREGCVRAVATLGAAGDYGPLGGCI